jgi:hypothetical protein
MRTQMIIAALVGSNLATGTVLVIVSRRAAEAQRSLAKAVQSNTKPAPSPEVIFLEGSGISLAQREAMRASAIAARERAALRARAETTATAALTELPISTDPATATQQLAALDPTLHEPSKLSPSTATRARASSTTPTASADPLAAEIRADAQLVQLLVAFERAATAANEPTTLDELLDITNRAAALPREQRDVVTERLRMLSADGTFPALFLIARLHEAAGEPTDAARWYLTANIVRIIDSRRFKQLPDSVTSQRITSMFASVQEQLRNNAELRRVAVAFALDLEDAIAERPAAAWLLDRASLSSADAEALCVSDEQWSNARNAVRASLIAALTPSEPTAEPHVLHWRKQMWGEETLTTTAQTSHSVIAAEPEEPN